MTGAFSDAQLMGNGDLGVILAGTASLLEIFLGKNEFISQDEGIPKAMSRIHLQFPALKGASHHVEQQLLKAQVSGEFRKDQLLLQTVSWVQATDTRNNFLFTRLTLTGDRPCQGQVQCLPGADNSHNPMMHVVRDVLCQDVRADFQDQLEGFDTPRARIGVRLIGCKDREIRDNTLFFTLHPGDVCCLMISVVSIYDHPHYQQHAVDALLELSAQDTDVLYTDHCAWWETFWSRSFIEIPQKDIEKECYGSLYLLACCMRGGEASPTIYGNWVMKNLR